MLSTGAFANDAQSSKQAARLQFEKAEQLREALNGRPEADRTRREYQQVVNAYRKVYYGAPASSKADASIVAVAEVLAAMGRQFQPGEKDLHAAIGEYEFLRREYPGSKYRVEALFTIGQIYKEDLGDTTAAEATFQEFLRRYPHDPRVGQSQRDLARTRASRCQETTRRGAASSQINQAARACSGNRARIRGNRSRIVTHSSRASWAASVGHRHSSLVVAGLNPRGYRY